MLHILRIHLKISAVSILTWLNVIMPNPGNTPWHDECRSEQLLTDLKSRSLYADAGPSMSVPPYDLSTPLKQWRYLGEKNGYSEYFELDDVLVFPGKYTPTVKWQLSVTYQSLFSSNDAEQLALVVSHDQGRSWTEISSIHSPQNDLQYASAEYDGYANSNDLHFGVRRSGVRSKKLLIDQLSMIPDNSTHIRETESISRPQPPLASNHKQIINANAEAESNDALDISNYDLASFTELLKSYIEYHKELEAAHALPMDNAAMEGLVELKLHNPAEPTIEAIAEILWNQLNQNKESSLSLDNPLRMDDDVLPDTDQPVNDSDADALITLSTEFQSEIDHLSQNQHGNTSTISLPIDETAFKGDELFLDTYDAARHFAINPELSYPRYLDNHAVRSSYVSCHELTKEFFEFTQSAAMRTAQVRTENMTAYYNGYKQYKKENFSTLKEGLEILRKKYHQEMNECGYKVGAEPEPSMFGEPYNLCILGSVSYDLVLSMTNKDVEKSARAASTGIKYNMYLMPGGAVEKMKDFIHEQCVSNEKKQNQFEIYDIPIFENTLKNYLFFNSDEAKTIKKNLEKGIITKVFDKINVTCSEAISKIDAQNRHWNAMVSAIDTTYALVANKYSLYSYHYLKTPVSEINILPTIMRTAATILSSKGYLAQNIAAYESNCITSGDASEVYSTSVVKEDIDFLNNNRKPAKANLKSSMDSIVAKEFNGFSPPKLVLTTKE